MSRSGWVRRSSVAVAAALTAVLVLALAGCGGGQGGGTATPSVATPVTSETAPGGQATPAPGKPKYGGTIKFIGAYMGNTDPHTQPNQIATAPFWMTTSNQLFRATAGFKVEPDLVEKWEQQGDTTWVLQIHQNVKWQNVPPTNGRPFTAADVKYNIDRISTPGPKFPYNDTFKTITDVEVVDDHTVKLTLSRPNVYFLNTLAIPALCMVPKELVDKSENQSIGLEAVGTGPFILTGYKPDVAAKLERNPDYWKKDEDGNQLPYLDGFEMVYIVDATAAEAALASGQIQMGSVAPINVQPFLKAHPDIADIVYKSANPWMIVMNTKIKPFDDVRVRQAVMYATNRDEYGQLMYRGDWVPLYGPVPEVFEDWAVGEAGGSNYDPVKARQLLAEAGYPDGFKTEALESALYIGGAQVGQSQLKKELGIDVSLKSLSLGEWASRVYRGESAIFWYVDQAFTLPSQYIDRRFMTGASGNWTFYSNPEVDELVDQHYAQTDPKEAQRLLKEAQRIIIDEAPHVYLVCPVGHFMYYNYLQNFRSNEAGTGSPASYGLERVWLDK